VIATLAASGHVPEARLAELLQDAAFAAWLRARDGSPPDASAVGRDGRLLTPVGHRDAGEEDCQCCV